MNRLWCARALVALILMGVAAGAAGVPSTDDSHVKLSSVKPLAEQGVANAQYNLAVIYAHGYGVERDYDKARHWYEKAAAQGYAKAAHNLGVMYQSGQGVDVDYAQAAHWFRKAAKLGESASANNLAVLYARGRGVPRDLSKAALWAARAAQAGNDSAVANLAMIAGHLPQARVDTDYVNVRAEPGMDAIIEQQLAAGTSVVVLGQRDDWAHVLIPGNHVLGWVANFLLTRTTASTETDTAQQAATTASSGPSRVINAAVVNVRQRPTTQSAVLFQVHEGARVHVLKDRNDWKYVQFADGRKGWVAGFLLSGA